MDELDRAAIEQERAVQVALNNHKYRPVISESSLYCEDCGDEIPAARLAVIKTNLCIVCARENEKWR